MLPLQHLGHYCIDNDGHDVNVCSISLLASEELSKWIYLTVVTQITDEQQGNFNWLTTIHLGSLVAEGNLAEH